MFNPRYSITNKLLANIKKISLLVNELNDRRFPNIVLLGFEKTALAVSAYASTSIEGNPLPLTQVKEILKSKPSNIRDSEKEVLNYNQALQELNKKLKDKVTLSLDLILKIQKQIIQSLLPAFELGHLREKPVVVNDPRTGQTVYLPPDVKDVKPLIEDLIEFTKNNRNTIDSLVLAGIFHKQMVIIHPFMDGNGRTARLATKILLAQMGLNTFNLFSFENYYNKNVTKYFQTVGEFGSYYDLAGKIDFTLWLEYFTDGIIDELLRVGEILPKTAIGPKTELQDYHLKILRFIKDKGFIKDRDYAKLTERAKATRTQDFKKLRKLGFIERKAKGKATYYVLKDK
ncbi:Fic family protein [Candidatus Microgenomates bacterium]|nr:MAG: Fic family protein [Candidatus Microgenomates bacterium]